MWGIIKAMKLEGVAIQDVINYLAQHKKYVTIPLRQQLIDVLDLVSLIEGQKPKYYSDEPVDIVEEVQEQLKLVRQIRLEVSESETKTKDLSDLVRTSNTLFATLTKYNNDIENQEKVKKLERATVSSLSELAPEEQEKFLNELERVLSK